jgi:excisionase family DNA binding protein
MSVSPDASGSVAAAAESLTPAEAAAALGTSASTIRRWLADGRMEGVRIGGRLRIEPEAVQRMVRPATEERRA